MFKPFYMDNSENTLYFKPGDSDGFIVCETENEKNMVYFYYSEIDMVIGCLVKIKKEVK